MIAASPELHSYAVQKMYLALQDPNVQQILLQVCFVCKVVNWDDVSFCFTSVGLVCLQFGLVAVWFS